jgi:hypothetical protein
MTLWSGFHCLNPLVLRKKLRGHVTSYLRKHYKWRWMLLFTRTQVKESGRYGNDVRLPGSV